ncbi:reverse transcriptase domain-containing protein [Tanacetum coccineum]
MPFGLKNAGATYQRLVDKAFEKQVGRNLEVYVDDLVIKSHTEAELLRDIEETFRTLRKINMKLNPKKFKEVQSLNGKLAGLNRFLSKSAEKSLSLFKTLKKCIKKSDFCWTPEVEQAFKQLKQHISELPMLVAPRPKEELIMYLSASQGAVGTILMTEMDSIQTPVYFVSQALQVPELNYTLMEKLVLALVFAAKRLRRYFQAYLIAVITDQPIRQVMSRPEISLWINQRKPQRTCQKMRPHKNNEQFTYTIRFQFTASNNEAEYEALLDGLRIAAQIGVRNIRVSVDSKLVANQVLGTYIAKEENMIKYLEKVKSLVSGFASFSISQVPRSQNQKADALSKIASTSFAHLSKQVLVEIRLPKPSRRIRKPTIVDGHLAVVSLDEDGNNFRIWVMKEYNNDASWHALFKFSYKDIGPFNSVMQLPTNGYYFLIDNKSKRLEVYNPNTGVRSFYLAESIFKQLFKWETCVESLELLDSGWVESKCLCYECRDLPAMAADIHP